MPIKSEQLERSLLSELACMRHKTAELEARLSALKENQQDLEHIKQNYLQIKKYARAGIYEYDIEKACFTDVNEYMCEIIGVPKDEILGINPFVFLTPESLQEFKERREKLLRGERVPDVVELEFIRRGDGERRWVLLSQNFFPSQGRPTKALGVAHDITERKVAEQVIVSAKEQWEKTFDTVPDLIAMIDADYKITRVNKTMANSLGKTPAECIGTRCHELFHNRKGPPPDCPHVRLKQSGEEQVSELYISKLDRSYQVTATPLRENGNFVGCVHIAHDITEQKRIQNRLEESRVAAELANRAKSDFLANISHEIRTPLTAVLGYADLLSDTALDKSKLSDYIKAINRNGHLLMSLIDDILDLSKIEAGRIQIRRTRVATEKVLEGIASLMKIRAKEKSLSLKITHEFPLPKEIETDPTRLRQILLNMVGNAIKFTGKGFVHLKVRCTEEQRKRGEIQFEVTDSGIGMNPDQIHQLFRPFMQGDTSTARQFGGTGLGLAISKRLATLLGGQIEVKSTPDEGSSFIVTISAGSLENVLMVNEFPKPKATPSTLTKSPIQHSFQGKVLVAEDSVDSQELIGFILKKTGLNVDIAENGRVAYKKAITSKVEGEPYDLILMDIQMPEIDGYEATRRLRRDGWLNPIVALTAHAMTGDKELCLKAGCNDHLPKPIDQTYLMTTLNKFLTSSELSVQ